MTRINVIPPQELVDKHLVAEYREIMRLPGNLEKSLNKKSGFSFDEIPSEYVLGPGHVKFFFDKMQFLDFRFKCLCDEMENRGFKPNFKDFDGFRKCDPMFYNDWSPDENAIKLNKQRIKERLT
jgi:deoxyribonuclease (pyrimidine dimer)